MFSRIEYSLKLSGKYALEKRNGVEADWDKFAKDHDTDFDCKRTIHLQKAVKYLLDQPPHKQFLNNGVLNWKPTKKQKIPLFQELILSVRRVRNNLFHGGKFQSMDVKDPGRNSDLLESSIIILNECLL